MGIELAADLRMGGVALPPSELVESPAIREAMERHRQAEQAEREAGSKLYELQRSRTDAQAADAEALAAAIQAGQEDPGPVHLERHDVQSADAERRLAAQRIVSREALAELRELLRSDEGEAWARSVAERYDEARSAWLAAIDTLVESYSDVSQAMSLLTFVKGGHYWGGGPLVARDVEPGELRTAGGEQVGPDVAVAVLRAAVPDLEPANPEAPVLRVA